MNTPTASSLQELSVDSLLAYYAPPSPVPPTVEASTDPGVFMNDPGYMKGLAKQFAQLNFVDARNILAFDDYKFRLQTWQNNYKRDPLPAAPQYLEIDNAAFDAWWLKYCAMQIQIAQDPPPVDYIVTVAPLPAPIIIPPPPPPTTGSPIGDANGANIFRSSASDSAARFGDQALYVDNTGAYVKHIYVTPFGTTTFWNKVA